LQNEQDALRWPIFSTTSLSTAVFFFLDGIMQRLPLTLGFAAPAFASCMCQIFSRCVLR